MEVLQEYLGGSHRNEEQLLSTVNSSATGASTSVWDILEVLGLEEAQLIDTCRWRMSSGIVTLDPTIEEAGARDSAWNLRVNARIDPVAV